VKSDDSIEHHPKDSQAGYALARGFITALPGKQNYKDSNNAHFYCRFWKSIFPQMKLNAAA
jgi:hypothetical protein